MRYPHNISERLANQNLEPTDRGRHTYRDAEKLTNFVRESKDCGGAEVTLELTLIFGLR